MKTSWLNGSKRILSALLIAAALMFGWTPLGEGKALAATDKGDDLGQQFADAAMLFVRENNYYLNLCNNQNTPFFYRGSWCATFVSVVARQMGIPTSLIPSSTFADDYGPAPSTRITGFHPYHESSADYSTVTPAYDYSSLYHKGDSLYVPEPGDIITIAYKSKNHRVSHVGIVCSVNGTSVTWVSGNYLDTVITTTSQLTPALQKGYYIVGFFHPNWESVMGPLNWRKPNPITGISLKDDSGNVISNKSISIGVHDSQLVEATVTPSNAFWNGNIYRWGSTGLRTVPGWEGLVWQSDNPKVASVNLYTGLITGLSEGTAHITAYAIADGKKKSSNAVKATVTVNVLPQSTNQYIACKITTNNLNIRSKRSAANPLYVVGTLKQDDVIYINPNDVKTVDNITWIYGYKADGTAGYFNRAYCDWDGSVTNSAHYSDYIIDENGAIVVYAAPYYENKIDELTSADGVFQIDVANMVFYDASGVNTYWAPCRYTKNGKTIEGYIEVLADPPIPCGIDREGDWERYEVTNASGAKSIHYPATFELSELSSYDQGEIIWLDRNERVTITENGKQYTFMRGHGDDFVAGWFDVTNVNEPLTQVDDSIEEVVSVRSGDSVYTFCRGNVSWAQAAQYASSMSGHLVVIDNAQEDAMLHSTIMSAYGGTAWTGGHANGAGNGWTWLNNNTMSYQNWGSSSATPTSSHTALAIKGDYEGWFTYRDCANTYVDSFIVEVEETPRAWFTYRTKAKLNIRKSQSISGAVATTTAVGDYLTIDLLNVAMDSNKKYFFAPVLMADGSILYCNIGDKTAIVPDLEPDEPAWTQYKALSSLYVRTFPNTWCDTGVLKTLSKNTILELDVSHKLRDPRFGNDWAYARYKQSDGTYLYGWVIAANTYVEQVKQTPAWYDYFVNPGSTVYVYKTQNVDDTIVKTYTSGSSFQVDVNNMRQDQNGYLWAPVADSTGKELGYTDLSAVHAGSKSAAIPDVYCQSGWMPASVLAEEGMDVLAAPNDAAALVKHMDRDAYFWFGADETYTDAKGKIWTRIYASKNYEEMADGGWVRLENGVNYTTVYGECSYTGRSISRNGITYALYGGYNSWGGASSWFSDGIDFNDGTAVRKHLAIVHNDAEQKIIEQLLNATSTIDKAWIGASNTSGSWRWVDGTNVQYSQWGYNEPSGTGTELGVVASFDGSWYAYADALDIHIQGFITEQFTGIGLPQVKLPASTFYVDDEAFVGNSTIQSVVAPDGLQVIGTRAFADCANLKCITLPDSVSYIAEDAFENTPDVVIFASVGSYAWQWAEKQGIPHGTPYTE
ncbi:MAG: lectin-like protein [Christensenellales bacterium]